ncbi:MAG: peptide ABC transporter ATP-binding protein, partial [Gammaproteobacteria bacterium]|nr:peptide ABC transporter ATP-binding protein [Gammaproteobacteria bacterium]
QILELIEELQREKNMAVVLITHDLGVVARMADDVVVMYAGEIVEKGSADEIFYRPAHPYTIGLRAAMPSKDSSRETGLKPIEGTPPDLFAPPPGCAYFARCPHAMKLCELNDPPRFEISAHHYASCWLHHQSNPRPAAEVLR